MNETIYDMTRDDFAAQIVGKRVVAIAGRTIELSDGTTLTIDDSADCCAWYRGEVEALDLTDNVVTGVGRHNAAPDDGAEAWSLHVLSGHKVIAKVNIEGDPTSGYYCHSVILRVRGAR